MAVRASPGCWLQNKQGNAYGVFLYLWQELAASQAEQFFRWHGFESPSLLCIINKTLNNSLLYQTNIFATCTCKLLEVKLLHRTGVNIKDTGDVMKRLD